MPHDGATRITKLMAIAPHEFALGISRLAGHEVAAGSAVTIPIGMSGGTVTVDCEMLPPVTLGGLLALPQARVTLAFDAGSPDERAAFEKRFDLAFRRGGG